jgi:hypothetical protein
VSAFSVIVVWNKRNSGPKFTLTRGRTVCYKMNKDVNKDVDKDEQLNKDVNKDPADTKRWNFYFKMLHASMWYSADRENMRWEIPCVVVAKTESVEGVIPSVSRPKWRRVLSFDFRVREIVYRYSTGWQGNEVIE